MALNTFEWENGTLVEPAKVEIGGVSYDVTDAQYEGSTPLSASNLNLMQSTLLGNVKDDLTDDTKIPSVKAIKSTYSETETVIGTWIDGKPIYRKVSKIGDLTANTEHRINVNVSNLDTMVDMRGFSSIPSSNFSVPINFYNFSDNVGNYCFYDKRQNELLFKSGWGAMGLYVILEYTKTTD